MTASEEEMRLELTLTSGSIDIESFAVSAGQTDGYTSMAGVGLGILGTVEEMTEGAGIIEGFTLHGESYLDRIFVVGNGCSPMFGEEMRKANRQPAEKYRPATVRPRRQPQAWKEVDRIAGRG